MIAALLVLATAPASEREHWEDLQNAMLIEAADGQLDEAARIYEQLVRTLPTEDATLGEAQLRLARTRYRLGRVEEARETLLEGIRSGTCLGPCQDILGSITLEEASISELPIHWAFDTPDHGFLHPWSYDDKGTIRIAGGGAVDPHLAWQTVVDGRRDDKLVVGFDHPKPAPRRVAMRMRSENMVAWIEVQVEDAQGRVYMHPDGALRIPRERAVALSIPLHELRPLVPSDPPLNPSNTSRLVLRDVSALEGSPQGPNTLLIDDFVVL